MFGLFENQPGRWLVLAAVLPGLMATLWFCPNLFRRYHGVSHSRAWERIQAFGIVFAMLGSFAACVITLITKLLKLGVQDSRNWNESIEWVRIGSAPGVAAPAQSITLGYRVDELTIAMMLMVSLISLLVTLYSTQYMADELQSSCEDHELHHTRQGRYAQFFRYLGLFASAMMILLIANNLFLIFMAWEFVGVASFLLIGFYTERPAAIAASTKAFVMNRIGDAGFLLALVVAWQAVGSWELR
ncbi:MAG: proton-conducting transporter membrane subunit, partial [Gemmataceae bacterium]